MVVDAVIFGAVVAELVVGAVVIDAVVFGAAVVELVVGAVVIDAIVVDGVVDNVVVIVVVTIVFLVVVVSSLFRFVSSTFKAITVIKIAISKMNSISKIIFIFVFFQQYFFLIARADDLKLSDLNYKSY